VQKVKAILGSALFFVAAPVSVAGFAPLWITHWQFRRAFLGIEQTRVIGVMLIIVGVLGLFDSSTRFALQGLGTPAPIAPTQNLVVTGLYRYVRNPMYVAVIAVIFGQAVLFGDWHLLLYGAGCWLACHLFVITYEEPTLRYTYAEQYDIYRANTPRWIPRVTHST
jgi:protein-S-isoprenylcysteine O-methyltransferase Ste14